MTQNIGYTTTYFKHSIPTPFNDEPTNKIFKWLKNELHANASSVDTDLGGDHWYLGLVLPDIKYAKITPTPAPFVALTYTLTLTIHPNATSVEPIQARENHTEKTRLYREFKDMEKALLYHIHIALEEKYIDHIVDKDTYLLEDDIPTVMGYLPKTMEKYQPKKSKIN